MNLKETIFYINNKYNIKDLTTLTQAEVQKIITFAFERGLDLGRGLEIERGIDHRLAKNTPEYKQWKSKKQNKNRDMEEFTADVTGDKAQAIAFAPNVFAKIKQAIQQVVSRIKTIVGVGNFNDYANVMARRLTQKLDTTGVQFTGGKAKFKITGIISSSLPIIGMSTSKSERLYNPIKKTNALIKAKYRISKLSGCILVT